MLRNLGSSHCQCWREGWARCGCDWKTFDTEPYDLYFVYYVLSKEGIISLVFPENRVLKVILL